MGPDVELAPSDLASWGDATVRGRFSTGSMNDVWAVDIEGASRVARRSTRTAEDLDWELDLLAYLNASGLPVPEVVETVDGDRRWENVIVMEKVEGRPAESDADYARVAAHLQQLHELTSDWPTQRPGWRSCVELVHHDVSGPVDVRRLPRDVAARCRRAWARLDRLPRSVVHGDPNPSNVRFLPDGQVVLLDWDEARIDSSCLDLARPPMPQSFSGLDPGTFEMALHAFRAWEAALFWETVPEHAGKQLARIP